MRDYEGVFIFPLGPSGEAPQSNLDKVFEAIRNHGGQIKNEVRWGRRTLAYRIQKQREGYYLVLEFRMDPSKIQTITERFRLMEAQLLRFLILQREETAQSVKIKLQEVVQTA